MKLNVGRFLEGAAGVASGMLAGRIAAQERLQQEEEQAMQRLIPLIGMLSEAEQREREQALAPYHAAAQAGNQTPESQAATLAAFQQAQQQVHGQPRAYGPEQIAELLARQRGGGGRLSRELLGRLPTAPGAGSVTPRVPLPPIAFRDPRQEALQELGVREQLNLLETWVKEHPRHQLDVGKLQAQILAGQPADWEAIRARSGPHWRELQQESQLRFKKLDFLARWLSTRATAANAELRSRVQLALGLIGQAAGDPETILREHRLDPDGLLRQFNLETDFQRELTAPVFAPPTTPDTPPAAPPRAAITPPSAPPPGGVERPPTKAEAERDAAIGRTNESAARIRSIMADTDLKRERIKEIHEKLKLQGVNVRSLAESRKARTLLMNRMASISEGRLDLATQMGLFTQMRDLAELDLYWATVAQRQPALQAKKTQLVELIDQIDRLRQAELAAPGNNPAVWAELQNLSGRLQPLLDSLQAESPATPTKPQVRPTLPAGRKGGPPVLPPVGVDMSAAVRGAPPRARATPPARPKIQGPPRPGEKGSGFTREEWILTYMRMGRKTRREAERAANARGVR